MGTVEIFERWGNHTRASDESTSLTCEKLLTKGHKNQQNCAYSKVVSILNHITDAVHLVQGPIECATCAKYAWNARGCIPGGPIFFCKRDNILPDNEKKLALDILDLAVVYKPKAIFVYSTCITEVKANDINAICASAAEDLRIPVLPVDCMGFQVNDGYKAACDTLLKLIGGKSYVPRSPYSVNILGDYNIAGDLWPVRSYFEEIGIEVVSTITGDSKVAEIQRAHCADLNLVQCSSSMSYLAKKLEEIYSIPYKRVSFLGIEEMSSAIRTAAEFFENPGVIEEADKMISGEKKRILRQIEHYKSKFTGLRAAIYLNGASRAVSLIKALKELGIDVVVVGIQDGDWFDRQRIRNLIGNDAVDINEFKSSYLREMLDKNGVGLIIPGFKEQFIVRKLNIPSCNICHNRISTFEGFNGMMNFAREIDVAINRRIKNTSERKKKKIPGRPNCLDLKLASHSGYYRGCDNQRI